MANYLLAVEDKKPRVVETFSVLDDAISRQVVLENERIARGTPVSELYYIVRPEDDALGLVRQAKALKTVSEPEPSKPPKPKRRQTRTVEGIKLIHRDGKWVSEDGRYEIDYVDDFETECDGPHPVRISSRTRRAYLDTPPHQRHVYPWEMQVAISDGKRGYYCEGNAIHFYALWVVWSKDLDVISRDDTFAQALKALGEHLRTGRTFA